MDVKKQRERFLKAKAEKEASERVVQKLELRRRRLEVLVQKQQTGDAALEGLKEVQDYIRKGEFSDFMQMNKGRRLTDNFMSPTQFRQTKNRRSTLRSSFAYKQEDVKNSFLHNLINEKDKLRQFQLSKRTKSGAVFDPIKELVIREKGDD